MPAVQLINILRLANLFTIPSLLIVIVSLAIVLMLKIDKIKKLQTMVDKLKRSLEEMDEQAKLIVRTDIELNKTQEELDKKITGLYALQRLSRIITTTLEESQIFKVIESTSFEDLGFEKAIALLWNDKENKFIPYLSMGYLHDKIEAIKPQVNSDRDIYLDLIKTGKTFSSSSVPHNTVLREKINHIFKVNSFVISPILPKEGSKGFFFVGTENMDVAITEGDEELITILSNQIGQALENARLFEKTWHAHQELEKRVEERTRELTFALEEVKKISKRKTDFISSVSHELRTPLTSIKGYAAILMEEKLGHLPAAAKERLEKINRHSDELVHMINDLLDISRLESDRMIIKIDTYNLKEMVENVIELLSVQIKDKELTLSINIPSDTQVNVDKSQVERVFINLIGNAIKFTPKHGKITLTTKPAKDFIQVNISDTGIGIPKDAQELIFEEFYRIDNPINQQLKGTGLGLSLAKNIIEAHRGVIWVESEVGHGSTFSFLLPIEKE
jgi:signal transduction histidine kinase